MEARWRGQDKGAFLPLAAAGCVLVKHMIVGRCPAAAPTQDAPLCSSGLPPTDCKQTQSDVVDKQTNKITNKLMKDLRENL